MRLGVLLTTPRRPQRGTRCSKRQVSSHICFECGANAERMRTSNLDFDVAIYTEVQLNLDINASDLGMTCCVNFVDGYFYHGNEADFLQHVMFLLFQLPAPKLARCSIHVWPPSTARRLWPPCRRQASGLKMFLRMLRFVY